MVRDNNREPAEQSPPPGRQESPDSLNDVRQAAFAGRQEQDSRESREGFERTAHTASAYEAVLSLGAKPVGMTALGQRMLELSGSRPGSSSSYNPYRGIPDYRDYRNGSPTVQPPARVETSGRVVIPDWALAPS